MTHWATKGTARTWGKVGYPTSVAMLSRRRCWSRAERRPKVLRMRERSKVAGKGLMPEGLRRPALWPVLHDDLAELPAPAHLGW